MATLFVHIRATPYKVNGG